MQNKKLVLIMGILVLLVGASAFIGGRLLSRSAGPVDSISLGAPFEGDFRSMIITAPELPSTSPEVAGAFVSRQDNTITLEIKSLEASGLMSDVDMNGQSGPQVEVIITSKTVIYRETTQPGEPLSIENQTIQQTVEQGILDELNSRSMVMVWGRRSGDRIVANLLMYSDMVTIKNAIFRDCEMCP